MSPHPSPLQAPHSRSGRARQAAIVVLLSAGLGLMAWWVQRFYPVREWLFVAYAQSWWLTTLFAAACLAAGARLLSLLGSETRSAFWPGERWLFAFASGVWIFATGIFVAGRLFLLGGVLFVVWPLVLLAAGAQPLWRMVRAHHQSGWLAWPRGPRSARAFMALLFAAYGVLLLYSHVLTPTNLGYDARWYHLPVAEHYVAAGGIARFEEGWYLGAYPHLGSWLYTWAFMMPATSLFDRVTLSSHLEFLLFIATLPGIGLLVRRLLHGRRIAFASAALFLFPGIFLYDSNLITGADHILAFWACPLALALLAVRRRATWSRSLLLSMMAAGAALTKYQAVLLLVPAAALAIPSVLRQRAWRSLGVAAFASLAFTASHWLTNWVDYGDPFFPLLHKHLSLRPFVATAAQDIEQIFHVPFFSPTGSFAAKVWQSTKAMATFAFIPHNWPEFHGEVPVFGFLFTLLFPLLLLLRGARRALALGVAAHVGVFLWFYTSHQERFLQALLPWMAASVACALVLAWEVGWLPRIATAAVVLFQIVWGGDVYFFRTHSMVADAPVKALANHLSAGYRGEYVQRFRPWNETYREIRKRTRASAKILVHNDHEKLGLGRQTLVDGRGYQSGIDYVELTTARAAFETVVQRMGATHAIWATYHPDDSPRNLAREASFLAFVGRFAASIDEVGGLRLVRFVERSGAPADEVPTRIALLSCGTGPIAGVYTPRQLQDGAAPEPMGANAGPEALAGVSVTLVDHGCPLPPFLSPALQEHFALLGRTGRFSSYVRKAS